MNAMQFFKDVLSVILCMALLVLLWPVFLIASLYIEAIDPGDTYGEFWS